MLRKVYYSPSVSGKGILRPFGLYRGSYNTPLGNLRGYWYYITPFMRLFPRMAPLYSRRPRLIRNKRN